MPALLNGAATRPDGIGIREPDAGLSAVREFREGEVQQPYARQVENLVKLNALDLSMAAVGQQEPGVVSALGNVLAGNCRCRSLFRRGKPFLAIHRTDLDTRAKELEFLANSDQKSDRDPVEKTETLAAYMEEEKLSQKDLARKWNLTEPTVSRWLAPLKMHAAVLAAWRAKKITAHHVVMLKRVKDEAQQQEVLERVVADGLSARELGKLIARKGKRAVKTRTVTAGRLVVTYPVDMEVEAFDEDVKEVRRKVQDAGKQMPKGRIKVAEALAVS